MIDFDETGGAVAIDNSGVTVGVRNRVAPMPVFENFVFYPARFYWP